VSEVERAIVPRYDGKPTRDTARGHRNPCSSWDGQRTRYPGNDRDVDARLLARMQLFAAAAENERVTALQSHHALALVGALDEDVVDLLLRHRVRVRCLAGVDDLDVREVFRIRVFAAGRFRLAVRRDGPLVDAARKLIAGHQHLHLEHPGGQTNVT
jgi:hypothetical protein